MLCGRIQENWGAHSSKVSDYSHDVWQFFWMNAPPATNGINTVHSPREVVLERSVDFDLYCRAAFGQYIHTHIEAEKTNNMNGRTLATLYLGPTGKRRADEHLLGLGSSGNSNKGRKRAPRVIRQGKGILRGN